MSPRKKLPRKGRLRKAPPQKRRRRSLSPTPAAGSPELDIYFLGAGASYVHGAPLTNEILPYALHKIPEKSDPRLEVVREFLRDVFSFDPTPKQKADRYPSLVDVLSVVDMALDRRENLAREYDLQRLREVRRALDYAIFKALEHSLGPTTAAERRRSEATRILVKKLEPQTSVIISLNYDVIIDIALARQFNKQNPKRFDAADAERLSDVNRLGIDYGLEFANINRHKIGVQPFRLLKLHGSFNWLWSRVTGNVYFGGFNKSIGRVLDLNSYYEKGPTKFDEPTTDLEPILITPTHLKDMRNIHLGMLWRKAEQWLRQARRVTFIGYSLPADDLHIKFLLKRAFETRRHDKRPSIVVVDFAKGTKRTQVQDNYERFFGSDIQYHRKGFDDYVAANM